MPRVGMKNNVDYRDKSINLVFTFSALAWPDFDTNLAMPYTQVR
jgi:hypothetical protein